MDTEIELLKAKIKALEAEVELLKYKTNIPVTIIPMYIPRETTPRRPWESPFIYADHTGIM